jgi:pseudouridine kinase
MEKEPHVVVIGAINVDIKGRPGKTLVPGTSNPGSVEISLGGVGRNIAENLARLKVKTTLISVVAKEPFFDFILNQTKLSGVSFDHILVTEEHPTGLFLAFINHRGDLISAIADMSILASLTPQFMKTKEEVIKSADFVVMDADVPGPTIDYVLDLCQKEKIPICVEPVSEEKAALMLPFLNRITMVTPNREEAEVLAGFPIEGAKGVIDAGEAILSKGVQYAIITLGAEGVYLASNKMRRFVSSISTVVEDSVGAGDSLVSGTIFALCQGKAIYDALRYGIATATLTLTTRKAVHPELSRQALEDILSHRRW